MSGYLVPDRLDVTDHEVSSKGADCFDAPTGIREQIQPGGWFLGVNRARRGTWSSGSCRGAGAFLVCHLTPGVLPTREGLIQTFHRHPGRRWPPSSSRSASNSNGERAYVLRRPTS
ncbi:hypothetical protein [Streptomyces canus]|uniref:hypothetical protein n=1 Tax=Streptomyces canus TaxID=58343 RepID=UPI0027802C9C|nr:hypothetical protein [Streptomyces canus]MDQ1067245.1 hypothetical protein [Streptomyces canus]